MSQPTNVVHILGEAIGDEAPIDPISTDGLVNRWQGFVDLIAEAAKLPCVMINRIDGNALEVQVLNTGSLYYNAGDRFGLEVTSYCQQVVATGLPLTVHEASPETRRRNPVAAIGLVAYLGLPLRWPTGEVFGTICVLNDSPGDLRPAARDIVETLRDFIERDLAMLEFNRKLRASEWQARAAAAASARQGASRLEFLARVNHELQTPLNAVLGFTELLLVDEDPPLSREQRRRARHIIEAGRHLSELVRDLIDHSMMATGRYSACVQEVNLSQVVLECIANMEVPARQRSVRLRPPELCDSPVLLADPKRLRQVIANLLSNAVKYNKIGGQVLVAAQRHGDRIRIDVTDTGLGMRAEQLAGLFQPFNRLGRENTGIEGSSLGLSLCKQIVDAMNGTIEVSSVVDLGTCVTVYLPAAGSISRETPVR